MRELKRTEYTAHRVIPDAGISQEDIVILFMGATGTGKSTFVDLLAGQQGRRSGNDPESVTQDIDSIRVKHPESGKRIVLVEFPGFDDTRFTEGALLKRVADWLARTYKANIKLSGIVYLHSITDRRMGRSSLKNLSIFGQLCGVTAMQGVVLVTTMWKGLDPKVGKEREAQLIGDFWKPMIDNGARVDRLGEIDYSEAWGIIDRLVDNHKPRTLLVQEELVENNVKLNETQAGKVVQEALMENISNLKGQRKRLVDEKNGTNDPTERWRIEKKIADMDRGIKTNKNDLQAIGHGGFLSKLPQNPLRSRKKKDVSGEEPFTALPPPGVDRVNPGLGGQHDNGVYKWDLLPANHTTPFPTNVINTYDVDLEPNSSDASGRDDNTCNQVPAASQSYTPWPRRGDSDPEAAASLNQLQTIHPNPLLNPSTETSSPPQSTPSDVALQSLTSRVPDAELESWIQPMMLTASPLPVLHRKAGAPGGPRRSDERDAGYANPSSGDSIRIDAEGEQNDRIKRIQSELAEYDRERREEKARDTKLLTQAQAEIEKLSKKLEDFERERNEEREKERVREVGRQRQAQAERDRLTKLTDELEKLRTLDRSREDERAKERAREVERQRETQAYREMAEWAFYRIQSQTQTDRDKLNKLTDELEKLRILEREREEEKVMERAREVERQRETQAHREMVRWAFYRILTLHSERPSTTHPLPGVFSVTDAQAVVNDLGDMLNHNALQPDERKRALHLLCKTSKSAQVFPKAMQLTGVECDLSQPINEDGAFGVIYKGTYQEETVCIKAVRMYKGCAKERLLRSHAGELVLGAHVLHPNVLPFYGAFLSNDPTQRICIVSPWMEGGNLIDYLKKHPSTPLIPLVSDILSGLRHLHEMAIVHADLKGTNVLISEAQRAVLADFGVSRVAVTHMGPTTNSHSGGTANWMAPERLVAEQPTPAARESDMWAFGCVCYEILARDIPFKEYEYTFQLIRAFMLRTANLLKPDSGRGILHTEEIWSVAEKCLRYEPSQRPTADEALEIVLGFNVKDKRPLAHVDPQKMLPKRRRSTAEIDYDTLLLCFNG